MGYVYAITSPSGGRYIGGAVDFKKRRREHLSALRGGHHHNKPLQRAYQKHGLLTFSILFECPDAMVFFYEQIALDGLRHTYNVSPSAVGSRGLKWSEESKARIRGRRRDPQRISAGVMRCTTPEERSTKARYARSCWSPASEESRREKLIGRKQSQATKDKRSASLKGRPVSAATRQKLAAQKGWKHTEEAKQKMRAAKAAKRAIVRESVLA